MRRLFLCLLTIFAGASIALAGDYYTYNASDGYWYYDGVPYTRYYTPGYWRYGCYYQGYYSYQKVAVVYTTPAPPAYSPNWKTEIIKYAQARDDYAAYLAALNTVGLQGQAYPFQAMSGYGSYASTYTPNASTQYGYSFSSLSQLYGDTNLNALYQQAAQLTSDAQSNGAQANANFQTLLSQQGSAVARISEILARGEVAHRVIQALASPGGVETKSFTFTVNNGQIVRDDSKVEPATKAEIQQKWQALAQNRCAQCHSGPQKKGGFDIASYPQMDMAHKQQVWARLTTDDIAKRMPRDPKDPTKPGIALTADEQKLFYLN